MTLSAHDHGNCELCDQQEVEIIRLTVENLRLKDVQCVEVTQPNGKPLPAPCAISGCQFDEIARLTHEREIEPRCSCGTVLSCPVCQADMYPEETV